MQAISDGVRFFHRHWKNVGLMYLINIAVSMIGSIAIAFGFLLVGGILFLIGLTLYAINSTVAIIYAIPIGLILIIALLIASGIISAYKSAIFTLTYKEIVKLS